VTDTIDILGLGAVAVDDVLFLDEFPAPDSKWQIQKRERHAGGLAGTALVAAHRMGATCAYAGTLGSDELSRFITDGFQAEGISVSSLVRREGTRPFHSTILVDTRTKTRTILFDAHDVVGADPDAPPEEVIRSARVLLVDHVGLEGMVRAARIARAAGIPVVADLERDVGERFGDLLGLVDHLILPFDFARKISGAADAQGILRALWKPDRRTVVITKSEQGSWYMSAEEPGRVFHQPAFSVKVVDTNGCGDVFHGVYAAGLSEGMSTTERIRFAAAVAALKATHTGGQKGIPLRAEADSFFASRAGEAARSQA
jgi:sugar/nucleoside kinase (ribokinase family)